MVTTPEHYRIGELARIAGVTVRALHHYDALGLLVPSARTHAGHRRYSGGDVQRLYRLLALRDVGLPLEEIGPLLERDAPLAETVRRHLGRVEHRLGALEALRARLTRLLAALDGGDEPTQPLLDALEAMTMFEKHYTPEQLAQLERRREALGPDAIRAVQDDWAALYAAVHEHRERGTDPADPAVQALVRRADELIAMFTGGDPGLRASLNRMYAEEGPRRASHGMADPQDLAYLETARRSPS